MKKRIVPLSLLFMALSFANALPKVAVLDISAQQGIDASVVVPITESIMEEVVGARAYVVLDRAYIEQVLKEREFELSGMVSDSQITEAGQYLGADYVVAGKVQHMGDAYFLVAKMIEVRTGVIVSQSSEQGEGKVNILLGMAHAIGKKLITGAPVSPLEPSMAAKQPPALPGATGSTAAAVRSPEDKVKAGFVIEVPADDLNSAWASGIDRAREKFKDWLDVSVVDKVGADNFEAAVDKLVQSDRCGIIFSINFGWSDRLLQAARKYPNVLFQTAGEFDKAGPANLGAFGFNETQHWYLQGLVAGALSKKGKIGVLTESFELQPWKRRSVNTFALGVKATNPKAQLIVDFRPADHWNNMKSDTDAARALVAKGCDFIWGCESPELAWGLESDVRAGKSVRMFLTDFTYKIAPLVVVSGPMRDWVVLFEKPLLAMKEGEWKREAYYPMAASTFGGGEEVFNPAVMDELRSKTVKTPDRGTLPLLELLDLRANQIASGQFEPFTGPLKDQKGVVRLRAGLRADWRSIDEIDWILDNVKTPAK